MEPTSYTALITYHLYDSTQLRQLTFHLAAYSQEEAKQQATDITELIPNINAVIINVLNGYVTF